LNREPEWSSHLEYASVFLSYLIGAVPFGLLVARLFGTRDIRTLGSGNIGATNVWRVVGARAAAWVYLGDISKGVLAVLLGRFVAGRYDLTLFDPELLAVVCGMAAVLGHIFPVYLGFRGGKGVNTVLGVLLALRPAEAGIAILVFVVVVTMFRMISLGSILGAAALLAALLIERFLLALPVADLYIYLSAAILMLIVLTHRQNIKRILNGTENRFSFSSRAKAAGNHE